MGDRACVDGIHRKSQVAMTLTPIGGGPTQQRATEFDRRGPWGAHFARPGNNNNTAEGVPGDLTRRWAHGPANYYYY